MVTVFAASSLVTAMDEAVQLFEARNSGIAIRLSYAASSTLARQIEAGAAADIYAGADPRWADYLADGGWLEPGWDDRWLGNELVVIGPPVELAFAEAPFAVTPDTDLLAYLADGERWAMGDPDHVPVGRYGKAALETLGLWAALAPRLAPTQDALAATAFVAQGVVPFAVTYLTDGVFLDQISILATIPPDSHPPIRYPLALVTAGAERPVSAAARAFYDFLRSDQGLDVFANLGFRTRLDGVLPLGAADEP